LVLCIYVDAHSVPELRDSIVSDIHIWRSKSLLSLPRLPRFIKSDTSSQLRAKSSAKQKAPGTGDDSSRMTRSGKAERFSGVGRTSLRFEMTEDFRECASALSRRSDHVSHIVCLPGRLPSVCKLFISTASHGHNSPSRALPSLSLPPIDTTCPLQGFELPAHTCIEIQNHLSSSKMSCRVVEMDFWLACDEKGTPKSTHVMLMQLGQYGAQFMLHVPTKSLQIVAEMRHGYKSDFNHLTNETIELGKWHRLRVFSSPTRVSIHLDSKPVLKLGWALGRGMRIFRKVSPTGANSGAFWVSGRVLDHRIRHTANQNNDLFSTQLRASPSSFRYITAEWDGAAASASEVEWPHENIFVVDEAQVSEIIPSTNTKAFVKERGSKNGMWSLVTIKSAVRQKHAWELELSRGRITWKVGDRVLAQYKQGKYYPGQITSINRVNDKEDSFDVAFNDGDKEKGLSLSQLQELKPQTRAFKPGISTDIILISTEVIKLNESGGSEYDTNAATESPLDESGLDFFQQSSLPPLVASGVGDISDVEDEGKEEIGSGVKGAGGDSLMLHLDKQDTQRERKEERYVTTELGQLGEEEDGVNQVRSHQTAPEEKMLADRGRDDHSNEKKEDRLKSGGKESPLKVGKSGSSTIFAQNSKYTRFGVSDKIEIGDGFGGHFECGAGEDSAFREGARNKDIRNIDSDTHYTCLFTGSFCKVVFTDKKKMSLPAKLETAHGSCFDKKRVSKQRNPVLSMRHRAWERPRQRIGRRFSIPNSLLASTRISRKPITDSGRTQEEHDSGDDHVSQKNTSIQKDYVNCIQANHNFFISSSMFVFGGIGVRELARSQNSRKSFTTEFLGEGEEKGTNSSKESTRQAYNNWTSGLPEHIHGRIKWVRFSKEAIQNDQLVKPVEPITSTWKWLTTGLEPEVERILEDALNGIDINTSSDMRVHKETDLELTMVTPEMRRQALIQSCYDINGAYELLVDPRWRRIIGLIVKNTHRQRAEATLRALGCPGSTCSKALIKHKLNLQNAAMDLMMTKGGVNTENLGSVLAGEGWVITVPTPGLGWFLGYQDEQDHYDKANDKDFDRYNRTGENLAAFPDFTPRGSHSDVRNGKYGNDRKRLEPRINFDECVKQSTWLAHALGIHALEKLSPWLSDYELQACLLHTELDLASRLAVKCALKALCESQHPDPFAIFDGQATLGSKGDVNYPGMKADQKQDGGDCSGEKDDGCNDDEPLPFSIRLLRLVHAVGTSGQLMTLKQAFLQSLKHEFQHRRRDADVERIELRRDQRCCNKRSTMFMLTCESVLHALGHIAHEKKRRKSISEAEDGCMNDEGASVRLGTEDAYMGIYYCGKNVGDGVCRPQDQCKSCLRFQVDPSQAKPVGFVRNRAFVRFRRSESYSYRVIVTQEQIEAGRWKLGVLDMTREVMEFDYPCPNKRIILVPTLTLKPELDMRVMVRHETGWKLGKIVDVPGKHEIVVGVQGTGYTKVQHPSTDVILLGDEWARNVAFTPPSLSISEVSPCGTAIPKVVQDPMHHNQGLASGPQVPLTSVRAADAVAHPRIGLCFWIIDLLLDFHRANSAEKENALKNDEISREELFPAPLVNALFAMLKGNVGGARERQRLVRVLTEILSIYGPELLGPARVKEISENVSNIFVAHLSEEEGNVDAATDTDQSVPAFAGKDPFQGLQASPLLVSLLELNLCLARGIEVLKLKNSQQQASVDGSEKARVPSSRDRGADLYEASRIGFSPKWFRRLAAIDRLLDGMHTLSSPSPGAAIEKTTSSSSPAVFVSSKFVSSVSSMPSATSADYHALDPYAEYACVSIIDKGWPGVVSFIDYIKTYSRISTKATRNSSERKGSQSDICQWFKAQTRDVLESIIVSTSNSESRVQFDLLFGLLELSNDESLQESAATTLWKLMQDSRISRRRTKIDKEFLAGRLVALVAHFPHIAKNINVSSLEFLRSIIAEAGIQVGDTVVATFKRQTAHDATLYHARVEAINDDGTYQLLYQDGDRWRNAEESAIFPRIWRRLSTDENLETEHAERETAKAVQAILFPEDEDKLTGILDKETIVGLQKQLGIETSGVMDECTLQALQDQSVTGGNIRELMQFNNDAKRQLRTWINEQIDVLSMARAKRLRVKGEERRQNLIMGYTLSQMESLLDNHINTAKIVEATSDTGIDTKHIEGGSEGWRIKKPLSMISEGTSSYKNHAGRSGHQRGPGNDACYSSLLPLLDHFSKIVLNESLSRPSEASGTTRGRQTEKERKQKEKKRQTPSHNEVLFRSVSTLFQSIPGADDELIRLTTEYCRSREIDANCLDVRQFYPTKEELHYFDRVNDIARICVCFVQIRLATLMKLNELVFPLMSAVLTACPRIPKMYHRCHYTSNFSNNTATGSSSPMTAVSSSFIPCRSLVYQLYRVRHLILWSHKHDFIRNIVAHTAWEHSSDDPTLVLRLDKMKAHRWAFEAEGDEQSTAAAALPEDGGVRYSTWSLFGQTFRQLRNHVANFRLAPRSNHRAFKIEYVGLYAIDAGGPYREAISSIIQEVQSTRLSLLIPTPNNRERIGLAQDAWVPNPGATHSSQVKMLPFVAKIMGLALRTEHYLALNLSRVIWKRLTGEPIVLEDLKEVDLLWYKTVKKLISIGENKEIGVGIEDALEFGIENFTYASSDGRISNLIHRGYKKKVTSENFNQYLQLLVSARVNEFNIQCDALRKGLALVVPECILTLCTAEELEYQICGSKTVDVDALERNTMYGDGVSPSDPHIRMFWEMLRKRFTNKDRIKFLQFVWARSRLPSTSSLWDERFHINAAKVTGDSNLSHLASFDQHLPEAHTCFFTLNLPKYSSIDVMTERMLFAITHCQAIDGDDTLNAARHIELEPVSDED